MPFDSDSYSPVKFRVNTDDRLSQKTIRVPLWQRSQYDTITPIDWDADLRQHYEQKESKRINKEYLKLMDAYKNLAKGIELSSSYRAMKKLASIIPLNMRNIHVFIAECEALKERGEILKAVGKAREALSYWKDINKKSEQEKGLPSVHQDVSGSDLNFEDLQQPTQKNNSQILPEDTLQQTRFNKSASANFQTSFFSKLGNKIENDSKLEIVYLVDEVLIDNGILTLNSSNIPSIKNEKVNVFRESLSGFGAAAAYAQELLQDNKNATAIVYKAVKIRSSEWPYDHNVDNDSWYLSPSDFQIIEAQPISLDDKITKLTRSHVKVENLTQKPISFVPRPVFNRAYSIDDYIRNIEIYLLYRTGPERGSIRHLRGFGPFKGYSVEEKEAVALKLLDCLKNPNTNIRFSDSELKIMNNGDLGKGTKDIEKVLGLKFK